MTSVEEAGLDSALLDQNFTRFRLVPFVAVPVHLAHILFFLAELDSAGVKRDWGVGIIAAHTCLLGFSLGVGLLAYSRRRFRWPDGSLAWVVVDTIGFGVMSAGIAVTVLDQQVTPAVTPFFVASMLVGVVLLLPPQHAFVLFAAGYASFYFLMAWTQADEVILLSNRANGVTTIGISFVLSIFLWRRTRTAIRQSCIIESQQAELTQRNSELQRQSEQLLELIATKDKLLSIIAHDLKNPFHSIIGLSEILQDEAAGASADVLRSYASSIHDGATRACELLDNLLRWAQMQQGALSFAPRRLDLSAAVDAVIRLQSSDAGHKGIELRSTVARDFQVYADADMLQAILRNLVSNAVKFTAPGGIVDVSARESGTVVQIAVADNGVGIAAGDVDRLFQDGEGFQRAGTAGENGTGLGLLLCKELVERHRGNIEVTSVPGGGSTFTVGLPRESSLN